MRLNLNSKAAVRLVLGLAVLVGSAALVSAPKSPFAPWDKANYASPDLLNFVRPGLVFDIVSAEIAQDGTIRARVRMTDRAGAPLDKDGITTPGAISRNATTGLGSPSLIAAFIPAGERQYRAYTTRTQNSPITGRSAIQAGSDTGGRWEKVADGEYIYTFGTRAPAGFDRTATHAIGIYGNRNLTEFELGTDLDDDVFEFVPDGSPVRQTRDIVRTATCTKCHSDEMRFHGETGRVSMPMCNLCHTPQTIDPDTGNSVDMVVMTHKIHMGANLPSVQAGGQYVIIGNQQSVHDYSHIGFSTAPSNCTACHESNRGATQHDAWLTRPTRAGCGSCHDNVNFATGEGHVNLPQLTDNQCSNCHVPQGELEFDASIMGAHTNPKHSRELSGIQWAVTNVTNTGAGQRPTVTFTIRDKNGAPLQVSDFARLALTMAGPTLDFAANFQGMTTTGYAQEQLNANNTQCSGGTCTYTFNTAIPAGATGSFLMGIEGRRTQTIMQGTTQQQSVQYGAPNAYRYFAVGGGTAEPRRQIVSTEKCLNCHVELVVHGDNRINDVQYCATCHNPTMTDAVVRPASANPPESIDLRTMIHSIHTSADMKEMFGIDYIVYGFGNRPIDLSHIRMPAPSNRCDMCHVNGSENLPLPNYLSQVQTPRLYLNPSGAETAACLSCHRSIEAASHALANTTETLGESCGACHGRNREFSVPRSHASEIRVTRNSN